MPGQVTPQPGEAGASASEPDAPDGVQTSTETAADLGIDSPSVPAAMGAPTPQDTAPVLPPAQRFLSDLCAAGVETNGWGPIERDLSNGEAELADGGPIAIGGAVYSKGLGIHAPSRVAFALSGACSRFSAVVGVDDEMKSAGSVIFRVAGDGVVLAETGALGGADAGEPIDIDVTGVRELVLEVDAGDGNGSDHADWADARVTCTAELPACTAPRPALAVEPGYELVWSDEFDVEGPPDPASWSFESGFVRNEEDQWYQPDNAAVRAGFLIIEGRRERVPNPRYQAGSGDWKTNRELSEYTSASLNTRGKQSFRFGRFELRARFPAYAGLWPAWWMLGNDGEWPSNGEIDILEFYQGSLHANFVVGTTTRWVGNWDAVATSLSALGDADWDARFHVYRMDWTETRIVLSVDGRELNALELDELRNPDGQSPFLNPAYTLINLAIGGQAAGDASAVPFPVRYEIDYVRAFAAR
jgi:beta-glucanase (GH16 family)